MQKREQNKQNAIRQICTGFFDLLQEKEMGEISMTDIANTVGMKRSTIYGYFKSVKEISDYVIEQNNIYCEKYLNDNFNFLKEDEFITKVHVKQAIEPLLNKIAEQPSHYYLIQKLDFTYLPILDNVRLLINKLVKQCNPKIKYSNYYEAFVKHALYGVVLEWLKAGAADPVDDIIEIVLSTLFTTIEQ